MYKAILTGETNPINKIIEPIFKDHATVQDKVNVLFSGTLVSNGAAVGIAIHTGMNTEIGII